ncbi:TPA: LysR family transcriptional regulator [Pseudomonas aeruginosa]|nr:LysR family transcriptional regulator [Pseudomonas aeruginosa]HEE6759661.1 LysR family transcriptional regulator [Pseudomonas aeruginosa]
MKKNRIGFSDFNAFYLVAKYRSFSRAAKEMGVSTSALSHAIKALETKLSNRLLNRTTRSVYPTDLGAKILKRIEPLFQEFDDLIENVLQDDKEVIGTLRLNVPGLALKTYLSDLVRSFLMENPKAVIEVVVEESLVDIIGEGFDAGVRFGDAVQKDMVAVPIRREERMLVVGAPSYFKNTAQPVTPADLHNHNCIRWRMGRGWFYKWEFLKDGEAIKVDVRGNLSTNNTSLIEDAAISGLGLAYCLESEIAHHIMAGKLVSVLEDWCPNIPGLYLYYSSRHNLPPVLRAFIDFVKAR